MLHIRRLLAHLSYSQWSLISRCPSLRPPVTQIHPHHGAGQHRAGCVCESFPLECFVTGCSYAAPLSALILFLIITVSPGSAWAALCLPRCFVKLYYQFIQDQRRCRQHLQWNNSLAWHVSYSPQSSVCSAGSKWYFIELYTEEAIGGDLLQFCCD